MSNEIPIVVSEANWQPHNWHTKNKLMPSVMFSVYRIWTQQGEKHIVTTLRDYYTLAITEASC